MNVPAAPSQNESPCSPEAPRKGLEGGVYLVLVGGYFLARYVFLRDSYGTWFSQIWSAAVFAIPLFYFSSKPFPSRAAAIVFLPIALLAQAAMPFYNLMGAPFFLFAAVWIVGWRRQERNSPRLGRNIGTLVGVILASVGLLTLLGELFGMVQIHRLRSLDPDGISSIVFVRGAETHVLSLERDIRAFAKALRKTYPYAPNHEGIREAWTCRIIDKDLRRPIAEFQVGNGNSMHRDAVWIMLGQGDDYQNRPLGPVLREKKGVGLWE